MLNLSKIFYIDYDFLHHLSILIKENSTANKLDDLNSLYSNNLIHIRNELIIEKIIKFITMYQTKSYLLL